MCGDKDDSGGLNLLTSADGQVSSDVGFSLGQPDLQRNNLGTAGQDNSDALTGSGSSSGESEKASGMSSVDGCADAGEKPEAAQPEEDSVLRVGGSDDSSAGPNFASGEVNVGKADSLGDVPLSLSNANTDIAGDALGEIGSEASSVTTISQDVDSAVSLDTMASGDSSSSDGSGCTCNEHAGTTVEGGSTSITSTSGDASLSFSSGSLISGTSSFGQSASAGAGASTSVSLSDGNASSSSSSATSIGSAGGNEQAGNAGKGPLPSDTACNDKAWSLPSSTGWAGPQATESTGAPVSGSVSRGSPGNAQEIVVPSQNGPGTISGENDSIASLTVSTSNTFSISDALPVAVALPLSAAPLVDKSPVGPEGVSVTGDGSSRTEGTTGSQSNRIDATLSGLDLAFSISSKGTGGIGSLDYSFLGEDGFTASEVTSDEAGAYLDDAVANAEDLSTANVKLGASDSSSTTAQQSGLLPNRLFSFGSTKSETQSDGNNAYLSTPTLDSLALSNALKGSGDSDSSTKDSLQAFDVGSISNTANSDRVTVSGSSHSDSATDIRGSGTSSTQLTGTFGSGETVGSTDVRTDSSTRVVASNGKSDDILSSLHYSDSFKSESTSAADSPATWVRFGVKGGAQETPGLASALKTVDEFSEGPLEKSSAPVNASKGSGQLETISVLPSLAPQDNVGGSGASVEVHQKQGTSGSISLPSADVDKLGHKAKHIEGYGSHDGASGNSIVTDSGTERADLNLGAFTSLEGFVSESAYRAGKQSGSAYSSHSEASQLSALHSDTAVGSLLSGSSKGEASRNERVSSCEDIDEGADVSLSGSVGAGSSSFIH
jgi:hypothetical protein